ARSARAGCSARERCACRFRQWSMASLSFRDFSCTCELVGVCAAAVRSLRSASLTAWARQPALLEDEARDLLDAGPSLQIREYERAFGPHALGIRRHDGEVRADQRRQVDLVDDEQVRAGDSWSALARYLFACRDVDHVNREIRQLGTERRRQVVPARFDEAQLRAGKPPVHVGDGGEVHGRVFPDCRVRAAAGLDAHDAFRRQRLRTREDELVLLRVDVIGDHIDFERIPQPLAQDLDEGGLARADGAADAHPQRPPDVRGRTNPAIWADNEVHERKSLVYCVSWHVDATSSIKAAEPRSSVVPASVSATTARTACSTAAMASWPSVCPRGMRRTPAVTRLAT